jgi:hypothetical protein
VLNTRCYRCGWSFTLSREAIAAVLADPASQGAKYHVEYCPRCRQALKLPMDQLKRALPPGWISPSSQPVPTETPVEELAPEPVAAPVESASPEPLPASPTKPKPARKRGSASAAASAESKPPSKGKTTQSRSPRQRPAAKKKSP